jgi:hypothetical protein
MKTLIIILIGCLFFLNGFSPTPAQGKTISLTFEDDTISADLKDARLGDILENLNKERGIWWKGQESVLEEKITVQFTKLSLKEGIERILGSMNHCLIFEQERGLVGVFLAGKGKPGRPMAQGKGNVTEEKPISSRAENRNVKSEDVVDVAEGSLPVPRPAKTTKESPKILGNIKHDQSPGSSAEMSAQQMEGPKVNTNGPTPSAHVQLSPEELSKLTVKKNLPKPGGDPNVTEEDLKKLKVIKNSPPPGS